MKTKGPVGALSSVVLAALLVSGPGPFPARADDPGTYRLPVAPEMRTGYSRKDWGPWADRDGDCRNLRAEILMASSQKPVSFTRKGCAVTFGLWVDPYTGTRVTQASGVDVDHIVPLQEAHDSGAFQWTGAQRAAFMNDPENLVVAGASANRAKGARGPEEWLPENRSVHCAYVRQWVKIKKKYQLSADRLEMSAIGDVLGRCR
jgi:hypothetical protein